MTRFFLIIFSYFSFTISNAQVNDNFTDGDYTANPVWAPSAPTDFSVNAGQLKSANTTTNSNFYISTTNTLAANCVWEFWLNLQFATSGSNYVDVYLTADNSNLLSPTLSGYFVRIGNTNDDISLYKNTAGTQTVIIDGVNTSITSTTNNLIKIKVTRTTANLFTLERDMTGTGSSYVTEGTITDASFSTSASFGYLIKQSTATFFGKHIFDDITVAPIVVDVTPPTIVSATSISSTAVDVLFNENIDLTTSQTVTNYTINTGIGNPTLATRDASNLSLVHLTLGTALTNGTYTIDINAVQDLAGNAISTSTISFNYFVAVIPNFKDIVINEIYADPSPIINLTATEFIELYNNSSNSFNLNSLKFTDNTSTATLGNYTLAPNSYVIICPIADTAQFTALGYMNKLGVSTFPSLNNASDNLYLKNALNIVLDSVNYLDTWYQDAVKKNGGYTLEQKNPNQNVACSQANNWIASNDADGGTPGFVNSVYSTVPDLTGPGLVSLTVIDALHITVCFNDVISASQLTNTANYSINNSIGSPSLAIAGSGNMCATLSLATNLINNSTYILTVSGIADCNGNAIATPTIGFTYVVFGTPNFKDIVINEIYADPSPLVNLTNAEFVELYNKSANPYNLTGLKLTDGSSIATFGNYSLAPNSFVIICPIADTAQFTALGYMNKLGVSSFPSLNNTSDNIYLKTAANAVIDSVNYSDSWYKDAIKKDGGYTLEQINPNQNVACSQANNWIGSIDTDGGTPGFVNSVYSIVPDITGPKIMSVNVIDSTHISVCFDDVISSTQLNTASNYIVSSSIGSPSLAITSNGNSCVILSLNNKLINATNYTITVAGLTDCNGNTINPNTSIFSYYNHKAYDVVINELMPDPDPAINLPTEEYVELKNRTAFSINLKNWSISSTTSTKKLPDITIKPDSFIVLTGSGNANAFDNYGIVAYEVTSFPALTNSGGTITLRDSNGVVINSITYATSWYNDVNKQDGGWSMEQIGPNNPCAGQSNWHASYDVNGGTPGRRNSVLASNPDNSAPQLERIAVVSADTIILIFTESLASQSLTNPATYSFDNGLTQPTYILPLAPDYKKVKLKLSSPMQTGIVYNCTVLGGIKDCVGNLISSNSSAPFALPQAPSSNDVVINEILFDPNTSGVDFVELYNRSNKTIDLNDLRIGSMDTITGILKDTEIITEEGYLLFPETYLVISESGAIVKQQYFTPNAKGFLDIPSLPSMNTTDDVVTLSHSNGGVIDNFKYTSKMHFPLLVSTKGVSLERIDFNRPTNDRTNWNSAAEAVGFATPAYRNSQYLQADGGSGVSISNPLFSPDNDGYNDVLNISYKLDEPGKAANVYIYDSRGRQVRYLIRNEQLAIDGTLSWNGINDDNEKAAIGIYVIYVELFNLSGKVNKYKLSCTLAGKL